MLTYNHIVSYDYTSLRLTYTEEKFTCPFIALYPNFETSYLHLWCLQFQQAKTRAEQIRVEFELLKFQHLAEQFSYSANYGMTFGF